MAMYNIIKMAFINIFEKQILCEAYNIKVIVHENIQKYFQKDLKNI